MKTNRLCLPVKSKCPEILHYLHTTGPLDIKCFSHSALAVSFSNNFQKTTLLKLQMASKEMGATS